MASIIIDTKAEGLGLEGVALAVVALEEVALAEVVKIKEMASAPTTMAIIITMATLVTVIWEATTITVTIGNKNSFQFSF